MLSREGQRGLQAPPASPRLGRGHGEERPDAEVLGEDAPRRVRLQVVERADLEIVEGLVDRLVQLGKPFDYMVSELCLSLPRLRLYEVQAQTKPLD